MVDAEGFWWQGDWLGGDVVRAVRVVRVKGWSERVGRWRGSEWTRLVPE